MSVLPQEDDPPLLVDTDAVAVFQGAGEFFKAVAGWHAEVIEFGGSMQLVELHLGAMLDLAGKLAAPHQAEDLLGIGIGKAFDHAAQPTTTGIGRKLGITKNGNCVRRADPAGRLIISLP